MPMRFALVTTGFACLLVSGCVSWWEHRELGDLYRQQTVVIEDARAQAKNAEAAISVVEAELEGLRSRNGLLLQEISNLQAALADARSHLARKFEVAAASIGDLSEFGKIEGVSVNGKGAIVLDNAVFFASGSHELKGSGRGSLAKVVELLSASKYASYDIHVAGHTDTDKISVTKDKYQDNWDLGFNRSRAVTLFMIERGVSPERVAMVSYGEQRPVGTDKAKNRRVEVVLVPKAMAGGDRD